MRKWLFLLLFIPNFLLAATQESVEVDVKGMTCPFCVIGINKRLHKLPFVDHADVSLRDKKARIVVKEGQVPDIDAINQSILDAGFSPGKVIRYQIDVEGK